VRLRGNWDSTVISKDDGPAPSRAQGHSTSAFKPGRESEKWRKRVGVESACKRTFNNLQRNGWQF
jgi:hypothetical protein